MGVHWVNERIADILFELRRRGVKISCDGGRLVYQAKHGILTPEEKEELRSRRSEIISFLEAGGASYTQVPPLLARASPSGIAPLTPYQRWLWRWWISLGAHNVRGVIAMRIIGRLSVEALRRTFVELVSRHESLRTALVFVEGQPRQEIKRVTPDVLQIVELPGDTVSERELEAQELIEKIENEEIDFSKDLLFEARLLELDRQDYLLMMPMHGLISDITSVQILWRDIWDIYMYRANGAVVPLPNSSVQPADWATWLETSEQPWMERHAGYWRDRLYGAERLYFFTSKKTEESESAPVAFSTIELGADLSAGLHTLAGQKRTSLGMIVLTAWVASIMRWCDKTDVVVLFNTTGRIHAQIENAIGCFQCQLFLRVQSENGDTFHDLLSRVIDEYDAAYRNYDFGRIIDRSPADGFAGNPSLNWGPNVLYADPMSQVNAALQKGTVEPIRLQPFEFARKKPTTNFRSGVWSREPAFALIEADGVIVGGMRYGASTSSAGACERFIKGLSTVANLMARKTDIQVSRVSLHDDGSY